MKHWRTHFVLLLLFLMGAALIGRLVFLQIVNYGFYKALAQGQQNSTSVLRGERGSIFLQDRDGDLHTLAQNTKVPFVFASPPEIENIELTASQLAEALQIDLDSLLIKLNHRESLYESIKKDISLQEEAFLEQAELPGIYIGKETQRSYPQGNIASHIAGFTNQDGQGQYGIEEHYNDILEGKEGLKKSSRNPASYLIAAFQDTTENGSDIVLTVDYHIQSMAESLLQNAVEQLGADQGTVIVIDPKNGKILALANYPNFDPNTFSDVENFRIFQNSALQKIYEPGSIFKPITMAAALNEGKVTPQTTYVDEGVVQIGGRKVLNYDERIWGTRSMTEVLEFSINTGIVFAEKQLGHQRFLDYLEKFGIFEPTNIDLAGEVFSQNTEFKKGYEINFATAAFGQGIEMTPLQVVKAFSVLANGGTLITPYLVQGTIRQDEPEQVISQRTSSQITAMLTSVVDNGFAKAAGIPGYYVAGKTGTAQVSWSALGIAKSGYSDQTVQSFIGYAPAFDPEFLILVKLDDPAARTAEYSALPVFHDLAKYIIDYYQIPPDYDI